MPNSPVIYFDMYYQEAPQEKRHYPEVADARQVLSHLFQINVQTTLLDQLKHLFTPQSRQK